MLLTCGISDLKGMQTQRQDIDNRIEWEAQGSNSIDGCIKGCKGSNDDDG